MDLREAIEVLEYHQDWRLGKVDEMPYKPKEITEALDILLASVKTMFCKKGYNANPRKI